MPSPTGKAGVVCCLGESRLARSATGRTAGRRVPRPAASTRGSPHTARRRRSGRTYGLETPAASRWQSRSLDRLHGLGDPVVERVELPVGTVTGGERRAAADLV